MEPIATNRELFGVDDVATADPTTDPGREVLLSAALADGRIVESSLPAWRAEFGRDPAKAAAALANLTGPGVDVDRLFPGLTRGA